MVAAITDGIKVSIEAVYQEDFSNPLNGEYLFAYKVIIENMSMNSMKLLRRHWEIFDSDCSYDEVEGPGVVGGQPIIHSGEAYEYVSSYMLHSEMGRMAGEYLFKNLSTKGMHHIKIPSFELVAPCKYN
jgi:ApaG protein